MKKFVQARNWLNKKKNKAVNTFNKAKDAYKNGDLLEAENIMIDGANSLKKDAR